MVYETYRSNLSKEEFQTRGWACDKPGNFAKEFLQPNRGDAIQRDVD